MSNIGSIYKNFFHRHKNTQNDTLELRKQTASFFRWVVSPEGGSSLLPKRSVLF